MNRKKTMADLGRISTEEFHKKEKFPIAVVLDNVRSLNNIGSIFRSSDAFCVDRLYLCGITASPPSVEIHKTALGAEDSVSWKHFENTADALAELRTDGWTLCAIEQAEDSISLEEFRPEPGGKYAIVLGHEVYGVDQTVVDACDLTIEIPQFGTKHSLNVAVTAGILLWHLASNLLPTRNV
ncbi:MAG: RNA methyltransferase [Bacteroides sp.]|nr:RNA methyltransferase [Bacteroides sp.]MCM1378550.1 RNA methyltransferase [Bacteroides sp.]MCM1444851.1 RNA methyltransferase [Prevotella sp.]